MLSFTAIAFSPWSEKARWALDHHRVDYREIPFAPVFGEWVLRLRLRDPFGRITVPVLQDGARAFRDSFDIARHAESIGRGTSLFPAAQLDAIREWNRHSEVALAAGRAILMQGWARTPELARAALPAGLPEALVPIALAFGRRRLEAFMAKYAIREDDPSHATALEAELAFLERALAGRRYLIGDAFSYADIAMALTLQQVRPVDPRFIIRMEGLDGSGMHIPSAAERHPALIAWRDDLYARHRRPEGA